MPPMQENERGKVEKNHVYVFPLNHTIIRTDTRLMDSDSSSTRFKIDIPKPQGS
jgi:hypothetical protein